MSQINETWKDIKGLEGSYQVSDLGRIRSLDRKILHYAGGLRKWNGRIMKLIKMENGYQAVNLKNHYNIKLVHRLVAETFIPNLEAKPCVNHINGIKEDNRMDNLSWVTYSENERHSYEVLGKQTHNKGLHFVKGHFK
ncbi:MAG TPA: NUMOD4 domain-containing protein [Patescibacteria group bacterium]